MSDQLISRFGREFSTGEVLFEQGDVGAEMFVIQTGKVRVTKRVGPSQRTLAVLGPGDFVGEMSILNNKPRSATATALEPTQTVVISAKTLESMVARNAEIAFRLIRKLAARLDAVDSLVEVLMRQDPRARVILGLSRLVELRGAPEGQNGIRLAMTSAELAQEVGVDPTAAKDVIEQLQRLALLGEDARGLVILDPARLDVVLEFLEAPTAAAPKGSDR
jgi:CRP/FNR family transcriptional regulator, cyclic AMP receptor protein